VELDSYKAQDLKVNKEKKISALHVSRSLKKSIIEDNLDDELRDEEIMEYAKKFVKRMEIEKGDEHKRFGYNKKERNDDQLRCIPCNKPRHIKSNWPNAQVKVSTKKGHASYKGQP